MSSLVNLLITSNGTKADFQSECNLAPLGLPAVNNFSNYIQGLTGGAIIGASLAFKVGAIQSVGTITQTSTGAANGETLTVAGVTFTARTSGASGNEWNRNNDVTVSAAALAAAINASTDTNIYVVATSALGVVTVTALMPGVLGNLILITEACSNTSCVTPAGGTNGTTYSISLA